MAIITGNKNNNKLEGDQNFAGEVDEIFGKGGNDKIWGFGGDDILHGGGGKDKIWGGDDNDTIDGGGKKDQLFGESGTDTISGGSGNDLIEGGAGADDMHGGDGKDTLSYASADLGVTVNLLFDGGIYTGSAFNVGTHAEGDTGSGFENITGSAFNDTLGGNEFRNVLKGGDGNDDLQGGSGKDKLHGGAGNDDLTPGLGKDKVIGGSGIDELHISGSVGAKVKLGKDGAKTIGTGGSVDGDIIKQIEDITGSVGDDKLVGNNLANALNGVFGDDILKGKGGDDFLRGGSDNDVLVGGGGNDVFSFSVNFGHDTIRDFEAGAGTPDVIDIYSGLLASFNDVLGAAEDVGDDVVITVDPNNTLMLENVQEADLHADDFSFF